MYCKYCGKEIEEGSAFCPHCGKEQQGNAGTDAGAGTGAGANGAQPYGAPQRPVEQDAPNAGFSVLGFFFPLIGLILYLVWKDTLPLRAHSCGKGALIGVIIYASVIVLTIILSVVLVAVAGASMMVL